MGAQQSQVFVWEKTSKPQRIVSSFHGKECVSIAVGGGHYAAVLANGELHTWGANPNGQLGYKSDETHIPHPVVFPFGSKAKVTSVSCGEAHTAILTGNGILYTWGCPLNGRLGREGRHDRPGKVESLATIPLLQVSCGGYHTVALTQSGIVYTWGLGAEGRLGIGNDLDQIAPLEVEFHDGADAKAQTKSAATDRGSNSDIAADRSISKTGSGSRGFSLVSPPAKEISAGGHHTLAIVTGKRGRPPCVYSWGGGSFGKLGHGDEKSQSRPLPISLFSSLGEGDYVVHVAAGGQHSAAVVSSGNVYTWGQSAQGRLGHPNVNSNVFAPMRVVGLDSACRIKCGEQHTCVITEIAELFICGLRHAHAKVIKTFVKVDFSEQSTAVENVHAGEGRTIILARQDRHAVMKILDRDHHGPFPSGIIKERSSNDKVGQNTSTVSSDTYNNGVLDQQRIDSIAKKDELELFVETSAKTIGMGRSTAEEVKRLVKEQNRTNVQLISTLSARIQGLEAKNEKLESDLNRAKARNAVLESMLRRALNPVVAASNEDGDYEDEN